MKNAEKWYIIMFSSVIIGLFIIGIQKQTNEHELKMAQAGLEQCKPAWLSTQIIWVKSCKELIDK